MATTEQAVVCDAGPIIHLDELGCLDLLNDFSPLLIPGEVWQRCSFIARGFFPLDCQARAWWKRV